MTESTKPHPITIDLNEFKLHIELKNRIELTLHFNSPSRRFYLSVIAFVVNEMKRQGKMTSIPLEGHHSLLALLNETIGGSAGSSETENLLPRIYRKWQHALPNLEEAPLFMVLGRKKGYEEGIGKAYRFNETEKDTWANLFEYKGSEENVRLKFAVDKIGATLDDVQIIYEDSLNAEAWERFILSLKEKKWEKQEAEPDKSVSEEPEVPAPPLGKRRTLLPGQYRWVALVAAIMVVLGAITLTIWRTFSRPDPADVASIEKMAFPLPDKPSIAVLPFTNMSGDPKQEFLCDGMTEGVITALTRVPRLFVIARSSTDTYKGKSVKVRQVSEEMGVRYVLEGSVQRSGDRVRITAQLIDALTGNHLWAKRYDRDLKDIFALQDEITINILQNVQLKLTDGGDALRVEKIAEKYYQGKHGLDCYLKLIEAAGYYQRWNIEDNNRARRMIEEVIAICPENPMGYFNLGWVYHHDYALGNTTSPQETLQKGMELAKKALAMDDSIPNVHALLCTLYSLQSDDDKAIAEGERALALDPGSTTVLVNYAFSLRFAGRPEEAIPLLQKAIRLNPFGPSYLYRDFGDSLRVARRFEEAVSAYKKAIQIAPDNFIGHLHLAITYSLMGREKEARLEAADVLRINPKFLVDDYANAARFRDQSARDKFVDALRKAGLK
jgi:adenylate cyclase